MTEPAWRHIDTVTPEMFDEGDWFHSVYVFRRKETTIGSMRQTVWDFETEQLRVVYGPIPDTPKSLKIRRFTADHPDWGIVSGVEIEGIDYVLAVQHHGPGTETLKLNHSKLKNLRWWD